MLLILATSLPFVLGAGFGWKLAQQGITASNALQNHQRQVYRWSAIGMGVAILMTVILTAGRHSPWIPNAIFLYVGPYIWDAVLALVCFCFGLVLVLELPGWRDRKRLQQLLLFSILAIASIVFLIGQNRPILDLVQEPQSLDGVTLQTTPYSCSAATIATLANQVNPSLQITEKAVVQLAGTTRRGTSVLAEIRAMRTLGLSPQYVRHLTVADLIQRQQLALLHVNEPVGTTTIAHAIALLKSNPLRGELTLGNPLIGQQIKTIEQMTDYWVGEAIFVTAPSPQK